VLELVAEDRERGLKALPQIDLDYLPAIHVRVCLDRLDKLTHLLRGLRQFVRELTGRQRGGDPSEHRYRDFAGGIRHLVKKA
jgi:hypothetical protein